MPTSRSFPLGKTGGLIEAESSRATTGSIMEQRAFPLGKTGGLIEAAAHLILPSGEVHRAKFPLGKTGGLIEASSPRGTPLASPICFRWVKPAASLKRRL